MFPEPFPLFFNSAEFGTPATYLGQSITVIFESGYAAAQTGLAAGIEGARLTATCAAADVPGVAVGSVLTIAATAYTVRSVQPDGTGVVVLVLSAP